MTRKFYFDMGRRDPIIGSMGYGGGGKLKVQGMDSYPVSVYIFFSSGQGFCPSPPAKNIFFFLMYPLIYVDCRYYVYKVA